MRSKTAATGMSRGARCRARLKRADQGAAPGERDRDNGEDNRYREPICYRPKQCRREVPIAVHVRIGVGRCTADEIECVLQSKGIKDRRDNEDADNDAVADELIGDYSLNKERERGEGEDLRKGNEVELFDTLEQLVVIGNRR